MFFSLQSIRIEACILCRKRQVTGCQPRQYKNPRTHRLYSHPALISSAPVVIDRHGVAKYAFLRPCFSHQDSIDIWLGIKCKYFIFKLLANPSCWEESMLIEWDRFALSLLRSLEPDVFVCKKPASCPFPGLIHQSLGVWVLWIADSTAVH